MFWALNDALGNTTIRTATITVTTDANGGYNLYSLNRFNIYNVISAHVTGVKNGVTCYFGTYNSAIYLYVRRNDSWAAYANQTFNVLITYYGPTV